MAEPVQLQKADQEYQGFIDRMTTQVIAAMPISVPDADLKRARSRYRVAFSADAQRSLRQCTPDSVARAIIMSAISGLFPGGPRPDVWLIPRKNKHNNNLLEANWQMSFRGYIRLARRAGWELEPVLVFEGERFEIHEGTSPSIVHMRNLDIEKEWKTLRYGYVRVFPLGHREQARYGYLNKKEIEKRRNKAQDQNIWNEWPLEQTYKTLCSYAGAREMFPTDDPARYAMAQSEMAEIGSGASQAAETWGNQPAGLKTANLAARLSAPPVAGAVIDLEGKPLDAAPVADAETENFEPAAETPGEPLTAAQAKEIRDLAKRAGVSLSAIEEQYGCSLADIVVPGLDARALEAQLVREVRGLAAAAGGQGTLG